MSKKEKVHTFTHYELNKFVQKTARYNLSLFLASAIEEFGWKFEDIERFEERLRRYTKAVDDGLITLTTIEKIVSEEVGSEIFTDLYMKPKKY